MWFRYLLFLYYYFHQFRLISWQFIFSTTTNKSRCCHLTRLYRYYYYTKLLARENITAEWTSERESSQFYGSVCRLKYRIHNSINLEKEERKRLKDIFHHVAHKTFHSSALSWVSERLAGNLCDDVVEIIINSL